MVCLALVWAKTVSVAVSAVPAYALEISASSTYAVALSSEASSTVVSISIDSGAISIEVV